ncbi:uncharacterized protein rp1l1a isoform X2 [Stigmatopora argus]
MGFTPCPLEACYASKETFYTRVDNELSGVKMANHKRSFKSFDALLDDRPQKVSLPFGVRTITTPTRIIRHLDELQDGGCYLCSDGRQPKPVNMKFASKHQTVWPYPSPIPPQAESLPMSSSHHLAHRHRRILLVKNTEPGMQKNIVLSQRSIRSMRAFLEEVSDVMRFHVLKIYTTEGRRIDSVQSLMVCPGVLVCVGREALSSMLLKILGKGSNGTLPDISNKSPGFYTGTPGNGAQSPSIQEAKSSPHGAQSRASECSEGQESRKTVNFGLETKKSIIHPRSDSSTRSTRFSLSSEKYFGNGIGAHSQHRPTIMNDDIEKRVLVNKDGSLSVEMRVRFCLRNNETLKWSTQIGKTPSLSSDCYPPSHAYLTSLQNGQLEKHSYCATFNRDYLDNANQSIHHALDLNQSLYGDQMHEQEYNLWENPMHHQEQLPLSPLYASHTHTTIRHTHSSSSSSSCHSMRVMHCPAKFASYGRGSDSDQSQLVQKETCVMEHMDQRVDMGQNEDTNIEVCKMSRCSSCSEVGKLNANLSSSCERSVMDEPKEQVNHPLSITIRDSSHVLQSLKEDQYLNNLPLSVLQCSHVRELSSNAQANDNQSINHLTEVDNPEDQDNNESLSVSETAATDQNLSINVSRASCCSTNILKQTNENVSLKGIVKASSGNSNPSGMSSVCLNCGGYQWIATSNNESLKRSSKRSCHILQATLNPTSHFKPQDIAIYFAKNDIFSTQSIQTNLTEHRSSVGNVLESMSSAISRTPSPDTTEREQERAAMSDISKKFASNNATTEKNVKSSLKATMSGESNKSLNSNFTGTVESCKMVDGVICHHTEAKSSSSKSSFENTVPEETSSRSQNYLSAKSNDSVKSSKKERPISVPSTKSSKSNISAKSELFCQKITDRQSAKDETLVVELIEKEEKTDMCEEKTQIEDVNNCKVANERATSLLSTKSTTSCQTAIVSNCTTLFPDLKEGCDSSVKVNGNRTNKENEWVTSPIYLKSKSPCQKSVSTNNLKLTSPKQNVVTNKTPDGVDRLSGTPETTQKNANVCVEGKELEKKNGQRKTSVHSSTQMLSPKRICSSQSYLKKVRVESPSNSYEVRGQSALSAHSVTSKSRSFQCSVIASTTVEGKRKGSVKENKAKEEDDEMELNEVEISRCRKKRSINSRSSISLGLPDNRQMYDAERGTSFMPFHTNIHNKHRVRSKTLDVQLMLSDKSKVSNIEEQSSNEEDPQVDNSCASPISSTDSKSDNGERMSLSLSSVVKNSKFNQQNVSATNVNPDKNGSKNSASAAINIKAPCYLEVDTKVNDLKQNNEGAVEVTGSGNVQSVKTSSFAKNEILFKTLGQVNIRLCSKETCGGSTMSTAKLKDTKAGQQYYQESSKANKDSNKQHMEKSKIKGSLRDQRERTDVTPACLPNTSPCEVVSDWLRSIPANSVMITPYEFIEDGKKELVNDVGEVTNTKEQHIEEDRLENMAKAESDKKEGRATTDEENSTDLATGVGLAKSSSQINSPLCRKVSKDWHSAAAVMKVLLSSSLGRCRSLPEVSPVYGRRLTTSARCLLHCLAQLQLIEPLGCQSCKQHENTNCHYGDVIAILQSIWLTEPRDIENRGIGKDQGTPPRSSSGVGMSSGSGGSGKEHDNQEADGAFIKESLHEHEVVENVLKETTIPQTLEIKAEVGLEEQTLHSEEQRQVLSNLESPKDVKFTSSDKSSNSSSTPQPRRLQLKLSNKPSQDAEQVWVLDLLKKLEKEFMNHYIDAMTEFKVHWDLDDSLILDTMIIELKDEMSSRIHSSIKREMSEIQNRSGRKDRSPRPPKEVNLSRESTMTEKRRRMLKIMKNQSVKTADCFSDGEMTPKFSDQQSNEDYCPCDACTRKKITARPLRMNPVAAEAPVMMEFDLLKILQLKKTPQNVLTAVPTDRCSEYENVAIEEVRSLEVVQEEEEDESSEDFNTALKKAIIGEKQDAKDEAKTREEVVACDYDKEKPESEKVNEGQIAGRSSHRADGKEEESKVTEYITNNVKSTLLEESRLTSVSGRADGEDEMQENGGAQESQEKDKSSHKRSNSPIQTGLQLLQQPRANAGDDEHEITQTLDADAEGDVNDEDSYNSDVSLDFYQ